MINGKQIRLKRLLPNGRGIFLALDHGFSMGPIEGLENLDMTISRLYNPGLNGLIMNYGALKNISPETLGDCKIPIIVHLSGSGLGENSKEKFVVHDVAHALKMGADAVSVQINFNTTSEASQIAGAARVIGQADDFGIPVLLMMYGKAASGGAKINLEQIVRLGVELGADLIKVDIKEDFPLLERMSRNSRVPLLVAGGESIRDEHELRLFVDECLKHGAAGVSIGRSIFQGENQVTTLTILCELVRGS